MADDEFRYDPEAEENVKKYRLPFALCKAAGIPIQDWWTPRNAWEALKNNGEVKNVSDEYAEYYRKLKREKAKEARERNSVREAIRRAQREDSKHNPDKNYQHRDGAIADVTQGAPMNFAQADSGNVNPYFNSNQIGYKTNCQTCVATYFARRQGYDVRALPNLDNKNIFSLSRNPMLAYVDKNGNHPEETFKSRGQRTDMFLEQNIQEGHIYSVSCCWKGRRSGHIVTAEREKGIVKIYDPQTNERYENKDINRFFQNSHSIRIADLTNYKLDENFCDQIMKRSEK